MIKSEILIIKGKQFVRQYSDIGVKIKRDGVHYEEAIDPVEYERKYQETDILIEVIE